MYIVFISFLLVTVFIQQNLTKLHRRTYSLSSCLVHLLLESFLPVTMFQRYSFSFIPFRTLTSRVNDHKYLTDVIGHLSKWGSFEKTAGKVRSSNSEMHKIVLSDESGVKLTVSTMGKVSYTVNR